MQNINLTGTNRAAISFLMHQEDDSVIGRFVIGKTTDGVTVGGNAADQPTTELVQVWFDKPESVTVFIKKLTDGYNRMSFAIHQNQVREEAIAKAKEAEGKEAKKADLAERMTQMAKQLGEMQREYAALRE